MRQDASGTHIWLVLWKATRAVEKNAVRSIAKLGVGLSDFAVLEVLLHAGDLPVNAIGRKVMLTSGSITTAVDRLEARGLVKRIVHAVDKRARMVRLTVAGRRTIEEAFRRHADDMEETMSVLSRDERMELMRLLKKVGLFAADRLTTTEDMNA